MSHLVGITTTIPQEVLLAADLTPVDLNNLFVSDPHPERLIEVAERAGFPQNCCAWIKGIYGVCLAHGIDRVLCVTTGDCSNTLMLAEVFRLNGLKVVQFAFPERPDPAIVKQRLESLALILGTTLEEAEVWREKLVNARLLASEMDRLTWSPGSGITGAENHLWLVSSSDFNRDYQRYERELGSFLAEARQRKPFPDGMLRLAYVGVPPVFARDLYSYLERHGARVVFNEVQRQFSMPEPGGSLAEQYSNYTYPYSIFDRVADINREIDVRHVDGVVHYVQAFCHRGIGDIIFRRCVNRPILTLEGNVDFQLSQHQKTRIEAFIDMLRRSQRLLSHIT